MPNYSNITMRDARDAHYQTLVDKVIEQMWAVRLVEERQYYEKTSRLKTHQEIWLLSQNGKKRDEEEKWLDEVVEDIKHWIFDGYKKVKGKSAIDINGTEELKNIKESVEKNREALR